MVEFGGEDAFGKLKRFGRADVDESKRASKGIKRARSRPTEHVVLQRGGAADRNLVEQRCREQIDASAHGAAAMEVRILLDEAANASLPIDLDPAVAAGVVDFGAKQRGFRLGALVVGDERAQI